MYRMPQGHRFSMSYSDAGQMKYPTGWVCANRCCPEYLNRIISPAEFQDRAQWRQVLPKARLWSQVVEIRRRAPSGTESLNQARSLALSARRELYSRTWRGPHTTIEAGFTRSAMPSRKHGM